MFAEHSELFKKYCSTLCFFSNIHVYSTLNIHQHIENLCDWDLRCSICNRLERSQAICLISLLCYLWIILFGASSNIHKCSEIKWYHCFFRTLRCIVFEHSWTHSDHNLRCSNWNSLECSEKKQWSIVFF